LAESRGEVAYAASFIEWFAEEGKRAYCETIPSFANGKRILTIKQPVGVCAAITPWNFPLAMITRKVAPALAAGCSILLKPAEVTPLSALALEALAIRAGLPEGMFKVICTDDPVTVGKQFCGHSVIRKLSFTGSTAVGKLLLAQCASTVKRISMELGGNAPFIIFDDADVDAAVDGFMLSKFRNAGQTCVCANRLLVQDSIHDSVVQKLTERVRALRVGSGTDDVQIGPLINQQAVDKVSAIVADAVRSGARLLEGGAGYHLGAGKRALRATLAKDRHHVGRPIVAREQGVGIGGAVAGERFGRAVEGEQAAERELGARQVDAGCLQVFARALERGLRVVGRFRGGGHGSPARV